MRRITYPFVERFVRPFITRPGEFLSGGLGPEVAPSATGGGWSLVLNGGAAGTVTQNGTGIHFAAANNLAAAVKSSAGLVDNATYEVTFTMANRTGGGIQWLLYGNTVNHLGAGTTRSANGTYTERVTLSNTGSNVNEIRFRATGSNGTNTFDITSISVKRVYF